MIVSGIHKLAKHAAARVTDRVSGFVTSFNASAFAIGNMNEAYSNLTDTTYENLESIKARYRTQSRSIRRSRRIAFDEAEFDRNISENPFALAELKETGNGWQISSAKFRLEDIAQVPDIHNHDIYFIRGKKGVRVSYDDLIKMYAQRASDTTHAFVADMAVALAGLTEQQRNEVRHRSTSINHKIPHFEFGETVYAYGVRMLVNDLYSYIRSSGAPYSRDMVMEKAGLKGRLSDAFLKKLFDHVDADFDSRNQTGAVLPVRGGIIGADVKLDGRALN